MQNPVDQYGVYAYSDFDINDNLMAYVQFNYTKSKRVNQLAQVPMTAYGGAGPQWQLNNGRFATKGGYFNVNLVKILHLVLEQLLLAQGFMIMTTIYLPLELA